ncbi:MAG: alkaline phosphatase family protein [Candidatus Poseidoniaceae archaeon]
MRLPRLSIVAFALVALFCLPSLVYTGSYIVSDAPIPMEGVEPSPYPNEPLTEGFLFVVLDGGRIDLMSDPDLMPNLNRRVQDGAYLEVRTNPLTMTAMCVKEMATGVPSRPNEALQNFRPKHPGSIDGFNLATTFDADNDGEPDNHVGIIGDYVWKELIPDRDLVPFYKARYGHADYYQGDEEAFEELKRWARGAPPEGFSQSRNLIVAHLSGLDSVGHRYSAADSPEYDKKLRWLDTNLEEVFQELSEDWTVVVTSDHGLTDSGQHGSDLEILRNVPAFMWGPNIKQGVVVKGVQQRDIATLPSVLFSLPMPHAVHGRIPLDAFDISDEKRQVLDQWNWDAAVARNDWLIEEGHPHIEDLSSSEIEWERLNDDQIGLRQLDLVLSGIAFLAITCILFYAMNQLNCSRKQMFWTSLSFLGISALSMSLSFNRDSLATLYYPVGIFLPVTAFVVGLMLLKSEKWNSKEYTGAHIVALSGLLVGTMMFPETRLSILGLCIFGYVLYDRFYLKSSTQTIPTQLLLPFVVVCIVTFFLSEHRVLGRSLARYYIVTLQKEDISMVLLSMLLVVGSSLLYLIYVEGIQSRPVLATTSAMFGLLPVAMWFKNNVIDWIVLSILMMFVVAWIFGMIKRKQTASIAPLRFVGFAWVTISWGAYAGAATMILYSGFYFLSQREFKFLFVKQEKPVVEGARYLLLAILPICLWFTWWAAMGQLDGYTHPRDIDPGNLYLTGGYIGDRDSPSNAWVGFMGGGPMILMTLLIFHLFKSIDWPLHLTVWFCILRVAFLSIHLSVSPNLPRLVFKISWDILLYAFIAMILFAMHQAERFVARKVDVSNAEAS